LLLYRFQHYGKINNNDLGEIDLGANLDTRLEQIGEPFAYSFKDYPEIMAEFRTFLRFVQKETIAERAEENQGKIVDALFHLALENGKDCVTMGMLTTYCVDTLGMTNERGGKVTTNWITRRIRPMKILTDRKTVPVNGKDTKVMYIIWNARVFRKLMRKNIPDPEEYEKLFSPEQEPVKKKAIELDTNF
jgi:hypothetical protein